MKATSSSHHNSEYIDSRLRSSFGCQQNSAPGTAVHLIRKNRLFPFLFCPETWVGNGGFRELVGLLGGYSADVAFCGESVVHRRDSCQFELAAENDISEIHIHHNVTISGFRHGFDLGTTFSLQTSVQRVGLGRCERVGESFFVRGGQN